MIKSAKSYKDGNKTIFEFSADTKKEVEDEIESLIKEGYILVSMWDRKCKMEKRYA